MAEDNGSAAPGGITQRLGEDFADAETAEGNELRPGSPGTESEYNPPSQPPQRSQLPPWLAENQVPRKVTVVRPEGDEEGDVPWMVETDLLSGSRVVFHPPIASPEGLEAKPTSAPPSPLSPAEPRLVPGIDPTHTPGPEPSLVPGIEPRTPLATEPTFTVRGLSEPEPTKPLREPVVPSKKTERTKAAKVVRWATLSLASVVALGLLTAACLYGYVRYRLGEVSKVSIPAIQPVVAANPGETILFAGVDQPGGVPTVQASAGTSSSVQGNQAGTQLEILDLFNINTSTGQSSMLSLPADLQFPIRTGTANPVKTTLSQLYQEGAAQLVGSISADLDIPVNHYVQLNFSGFKSMVDAVGGVNLDFPFPARDIASGFYELRDGCNQLNGTEAVQLVRSQSYQYLDQGTWVTDTSGTAGQLTRELTFLGALGKAASKVVSNPFEANGFLGAAVGDITLDSSFGISSLMQLGRLLSSHEFSGAKAFSFATSPTGNGSIQVSDSSSVPMVVSQFLNSVSGQANAPTSPPNPALAPPGGSITTSAPSNAAQASPWDPKSC